MKTLAKYLLKKSLRFRWGERLYRKISKSTPESVRNRVAMIKKLQAENPVAIFIETGTHLGDTLEQVRENFEWNVSIEIEPHFAAFCGRRFGSKNVVIIQGDSAEKLPQVVNTALGNCGVFLDAHFSGGISGRGKKNTPLWEELGSLKGNVPRWIIIDDIDELGKNGYPSLDKVSLKLKELGFEKQKVEQNMLINERNAAAKHL